MPTLKDDKGEFVFYEFAIYSKDFAPFSSYVTVYDCPDMPNIRQIAREIIPKDKYGIPIDNKNIFYRQIPQQYLESKAPDLVFLLDIYKTTGYRHSPLMFLGNTLEIDPEMEKNKRSIPWL